MQPLRRLLNSRSASIVATQKRNNPAVVWFARGTQWSLTIGEMLAPNINVLTSVRTAAAAVSEMQQSACQQKRTPEFFQDENPPLFVDATVRYTESRLDHRFLANDRRYICRDGVLFLWLNGFLVQCLSQVVWDFLFLSTPSKGIQIPERRNVFVWCNPESKKFYWQRIDSEIGNPSSTDKKIRNSLESSTGE